MSNEEQHQQLEQVPVESVEGRPEAKGNAATRNAPRAQDRQGAPMQVMRIGQRAKEKKGERFDNLLSAIKAPLLKEAYQRLRRHAAPGVDGITWKEYGEHLDARLLDLQDRIHRGSYHPQPVRRVHIPKGAACRTWDELGERGTRRDEEPYFSRVTRSNDAMRPRSAVWRRETYRDRL